MDLHIFWIKSPIFGSAPIRSFKKIFFYIFDQGGGSKLPQNLCRLLKTVPCVSLCYRKCSGGGGVGGGDSCSGFNFSLCFS